MNAPRSNVPTLDGILAGSEEPVFRVLPQRVIEDMRRPNSESALVWNLIYPLAQPTLQMEQLLAIKPMWGTFSEGLEDSLIPFYWGYGQEGDRLPCLDQVLEDIDGPGPRTEVDLYLMGQSELVLIEAKNLAGLGRCSRFGSGRCPEIHGSTAEKACRYWDRGGPTFSSMLDFGPRPNPESETPPCNRHYQLGRTALVGRALGELHQLRLHIWAIIPRRRWKALERDWIDFSDRLKDDRLWKRFRVIAWEDLASLN